jgi:DnaJ-class molecular chaperone
MTHYETLGVSESASADEIKKAYRKLASQHHPDKGGDTKRFQEIQTAYDTLADADKRQRYDMERQNPGGMPGGVHFQWNSNGMPGDIGDIFRQFGFGGDPFAHMRHQQQPRKNKDLRIEIPLSLASTLEEQVKTVQVRTTNGETSVLEVQVPHGVTTGTQIRYSGLGDNLFNTLPRGDLFVQFTVQPAEGFGINNIDLYTQISVNCLKAITGGTVIVTGLDGTAFEMTLPPGTQPGMKFRLRGQGLYQMNTNQRGDLYAELAITIPNNLTADQINYIQTIVNSQ